MIAFSRCHRGAALPSMRKLTIFLASFQRHIAYRAFFAKFDFPRQFPDALTETLWP
ncbi:hypothetical protein UYSO10_3928 [Kosakonia radicincitans]|nr:hypothetical protein UYSO10_3928 [Kosakonia radicincitans]